ncbi:hypothetical protein N185_17610 [Sinorhizobium sp. GW3]|nr:hypothetical protein N185_17610 [Sinorhizobium sp. GW3]
MISEKKRLLLGQFLRARREALEPETPKGRRRTPGLTREEVAFRAGISTTWCTWIEQGRDVHASPEALSRLADALKLSAGERKYVFELAGRLDPNEPADYQASAPQSVLAILEELRCPAYGLDADWTILCWNSAANRLFEGWLAMRERPNLLEYVFCEPAARKLIPNWQDRARRLVSEFRADYGHTHADPRVGQLIAKLIDSSKPFRNIWHEQNVEVRAGGTRTFHHPTDGLLTFSQYTFTPTERADFKLVVLSDIGHGGG